MTARARLLLVLLAGLAALAVGTLAGWNEAVASLLVAPSLPVRLSLGTAALLVGAVLVLRSAEALGASREPAELVRSVRIVFLAVAALAASAGWFLGSALPIVAGLVIAGIDVVETSILLLVTAVRGESGRPR